VLRHRLLTEAESSVQLNAEVASRWGHLFRLEVPQELHQEMLSQQAACDTIIASKDAIVAAMRSQLHDKDDEYVRMLKQQGEDVDLLLLNMGKQLEEMQTAYRNELAQIDDAYMQVCGLCLVRVCLLQKHLTLHWRQLAGLYTNMSCHRVVMPFERNAFGKA
jgi:dynein regulatory complex protein 1